MFFVPAQIFPIFLDGAVPVLLDECLDVSGEQLCTEVPPLAGKDDVAEVFLLLADDVCLTAGTILPPFTADDVAEVFLLLAKEILDLLEADNPDAEVPLAG